MVLFPDTVFRESTYEAIIENLLRDTAGIANHFRERPVSDVRSGFIVHFTHKYNDWSEDLTYIGNLLYGYPTYTARTMDLASDLFEALYGAVDIKCNVEDFYTNGYIVSPFLVRGENGDKPDGKAHIVINGREHKISIQATDSSSGCPIVMDINIDWLINNGWINVYKPNCRVRQNDNAVEKGLDVLAKSRYRLLPYALIRRDPDFGVHFNELLNTLQLDPEWRVALDLEGKIKWFSEIIYQEVCDYHETNHFSYMYRKDVYKSLTTPINTLIRTLLSKDEGTPQIEFNVSESSDPKFIPEFTVTHHTINTYTATI